MPKPIQAEITALSRSLRRIREDFEDRCDELEREIAELKSKAETKPEEPKGKRREDDDD